MKKARVIFYLIVSLVLLFAMTCKSSAMTISSSSTPNTVDSGAEFYITLKLDEPVTSFNAHINYDSDLFTISDKAETANTTINPTYAKGDASFLYTALDGKTTLDTFKIKVKAAEVTEEKSATFTVSNMEAVTTTAPNGERLDKMTFSVSIKPTEKKEELTISESTVNLKIGESKTLTTNSKGTLEW